MSVLHDQRREPPGDSDETLLRSIVSAEVERRLAYNRGDKERANFANHVGRERVEHAMQRFAEINGWVHKLHDEFTIHQIAERGLHGNNRNLRSHWNPAPGCWRGDWYHIAFDHARYFRKPTRRAMAIAAQPYCEPEETRARLDIAAAELGFEIHTPPGGIYASFHVPGHTSLFVVTRPGETVRWLPEQAEPRGFDERTKLEREMQSAREAA
jgi:hypothetical protein